MSEENIDLVSGATGLGRAEAKQLLGAADGDVETAVNLFLSGDFSPAAATAASAPPPPSAPSSHPTSSSRPPAPSSARSSGPPPFSSSASGSSSSARAPAKAAASGGPRIATFSSLASGHGDGSEDEEEDGKKGDQFFAGGGIAIQGPNSGNLKDAMFSRAKKLGAKEAGESEAAGEKVSIVFYSDGFALMRGGILGPLRAPSDPANASFLRSVGNGEIPEELKSLGNDVHVALVDKHTEAYPPMPKATFTGEGVTVGGGPTNPSAVYAGGEGEPSAVSCDMDQPHTKIQIRLADGTRLVAHLNLTHTLADVYAFVRSSTPDRRPFVLSTTYPRADLVAGPKTIVEAGLSNAVIVKRWV